MELQSERTILCVKEREACSSMQAYRPSTGEKLSSRHAISRIHKNFGIERNLIWNTSETEFGTHQSVRKQSLYPRS